jgi:voltage-gated potassium channel
VLSAVFVLGIVGFMWIEHWTFLESTYMVVITIFTIGFQEVHSLSNAGRVLTMVIAVAGVGTVIYAAGRAAEIIVEGEILGYRMRRKMDKKIMEMQGHFIISGYGRVGHQVAADFDAIGIPYVIVDSKSETVVELKPRGVPHLIADATLDETLDEAGIKRAKGLVACSDSDVANVYVTLSARALNPSLYIVARASQAETEKKLKMAGANRVISPYIISGRRMAAMVTHPVTSDFLEIVTHRGELEFRLHELTLKKNSPLAGKSIAEAEIRLKTGAVIMAIHKSHGKFNLQPGPDSTLNAGDTLVLIGTQDQIESLDALAADSGNVRQA